MLYEKTAATMKRSNFLERLAAETPTWLDLTECLSNTWRFTCVIFVITFHSFCLVCNQNWILENTWGYITDAMCKTRSMFRTRVPGLTSDLSGLHDCVIRDILFILLILLLVVVWGCKSHIMAFTNTHALIRSFVKKTTHFSY